MPITDYAIRSMSNHMPKVISPRNHAVIDYVVAGSFIAMGLMFWRRNRRAAVASVLCGGATAANAMMTDYPGGVRPVYDFQTHGRVDTGLAGLTAAMPNMLGFTDTPEAKHFRLMALAETAVTGMTDFGPEGLLPEEAVA